MTIPIEPNYRTTAERLVTPDGYRYSATGYGILNSKPWFASAAEAETFARCLAQAFEAGKQARSREFRELLDIAGLRQ